MKHTLPVVLILLFKGTLLAQIVNLPGTANALVREAAYTSIEGTPYFNHDFQRGTLQTKSKNYSDIYIRYDCYKDEIQFQQNEVAMIASPSEVIGFSFNALNKEAGEITGLMFKNGFVVDGYTPLAYFRVVYDGKTKYLRKYTVEYVEAASNTYSNPDGAKRFDRKDREYVLFSDGKSFELKGNRRALLEQFGKHESALSQFIKQNKLNLKVEKDLITVLQKFDELGV